MTNINIIYQDADLLVLDKPSGITVNKSETTIHEETVQGFIEDKYQISNIKYQIPNTPLPLGEGGGEGNWERPEETFVNRAGIVHRIDKETSGILLVAKTLPAFVELQRQFKERVVKKVYTALAHGEVIPKEGEISVPVGRLEFNRKRFGVVAGGRESRTKYETVRNYELRIRNKGEKLSLLTLYPLTGRTHQIRVHLKYLNHPIFSDELYGGRKTAREDRKLLPRLFLHASKISFIHPTTKKEVTFESPLSDDLQNFLFNLQEILSL